MPKDVVWPQSARVGRKALSELDTLVGPDTLLRWHRALVALKWIYTHRRRPGRTCTVSTIVPLVIRLALEYDHGGTREFKAHW